MIRGISKKIIEVKDTGSQFFEKAVFYVKSGNEVSDRRLREEADRLVCTYNLNYKKGFLRSNDENKKKRLSNFFSFLVGGSVCALVILCFLYFL